MLPRKRNVLRIRKNRSIGGKLRFFLYLAFLLILMIQFRMHSLLEPGEVTTVTAMTPIRRANDVPSTEAVEHWIYSQSNSTHNANRLSQTAATLSRQVPGNKIFVTSPFRVADDIVTNNLAMAPPGFELHVFNNSAMAKSVQHIDRYLVREFGVHSVWEAWSVLRPWAYRADLWRLLILWSEGGVYLDSKMRLLAPLEDWATLGRIEQLVLCRDSIMNWKSSLKHLTQRPHSNITAISQRQRSNHTTNTQVPVLWTGAMVAPKHSQVLLEAIRRLVRNVKSRAYSLLGEEDNLPQHDFQTLAITGPVLIGYVAFLFQFKDDGNSVVRTPCGFYHHQGGVLYRDPHQPNLSRRGILMMLDKDENKRVHDSSNVYRFLHKRRQVYCDDADTNSLENSPCNVASLLKS